MKRTKRPAEPSSPTAPAPGGSVVSATEVKQFAALFDGYSKAYGVYDMNVAKRGENGKVTSSKAARTITGLVPLEAFEEHLTGRTGRGVGIIMLRDDDTCVFGAIDYDKRTMDHAKAEAAVKRLKLPLVLCRSKSGGGHFYCFTTAPIPASVMRDKLDEWKALLGLSRDTETFPKQSTRFNENDIGNWINLPYFNAAATERYAVVEGQPASFSAFLRAALAARQTPEQMNAGAETDEADPFFQGPPCLQVLHRQGGFAEGSRNDGMMAVAVYLRKRYGDQWADHLDSYNQLMAGLPARELVQLEKSNSRKEYAYPCKKAPINACCQRRICTARDFGVGEGPNDAKAYDISGLTRYDSTHGDEPLWGMEINGKRVMVSNSQFYQRDTFNQAAMAQANALPIHMTPAKWLRYLAELISEADAQPMPEDAGPTGQLWESIQNFTLQTVNALEKEEVWLGKPYRAEGRVYFRSNDLFRYLDARKAKYKSEQMIWQLLRNHDGTQEKWHVRGRFVNVWSLPLPAQYEDLDATPTVQFTPNEEF